MTDISIRPVASVLDAEGVPLTLEALTVARIKRLPSAAKIQLQDLIEQKLAEAEFARKTFQAALDETYGVEARAQLLAAGRYTGTTHQRDRTLDVTVEIKKTVAWTQKGPDSLEAIAQRIAESGEDPAQYIDIKYGVSERKYEAWPESLKAPFRKARTVKPGKPSYRLQFAGEER